MPSLPPPPVPTTADTRSSSQQPSQQSRRDNVYDPIAKLAPPFPSLSLALQDIVQMNLDAPSRRDDMTTTTTTATPVPITPDSTRTTVRTERLEPPLLLPPRRKPIQLFSLHSTSNTNIYHNNHHGQDDKKNTEHDSHLLPFLPMTLQNTTVSSHTTTTKPPPPFVLQPRHGTLPPLMLLQLLEEDRFMLFRPQRPRILPNRRHPQPKPLQPPLPSLPIKRSREMYYIETTTTSSSSISTSMMNDDDDDDDDLPLLPEHATTLYHEGIKPRFSPRTNPFRED